MKTPIEEYGPIEDFKLHFNDDYQTLSPPKEIIIQEATSKRPISPEEMKQNKNHKDMDMSNTSNILVNPILVG